MSNGRQPCKDCENTYEVDPQGRREPPGDTYSSMGSKDTESKGDKKVDEKKKREGEGEKERVTVTSKAVLAILHRCCLNAWYTP